MTSEQLSVLKKAATEAERTGFRWCPFLTPTECLRLIAEVERLRACHSDTAIALRCLANVSDMSGRVLNDT